MPWILELHYIVKTSDDTVSIRKSISCPSWNTGSSDTIHPLYSKNDLHSLLAIPPFRGGLLQQPTSFAELLCVFIPASGQKCCIMGALGQRKSHHISKGVCMYVCVCVCGRVHVVEQSRGRGLSTTDYRRPEFPRVWHRQGEGLKGGEA